MQPPSLTTYLVALADLLGYDVDLDALESVTGLHTELVIAWAEAGGRHATIAHNRMLLAAPIVFLRANGSTSPADQHLLANLRDHHQRYDEDLDHASRCYAAACHALTGTGLVWPRTRQATATPPSALDRAPAAVNLSSHAEQEANHAARAVS
jgi:hypothetical protein